MGNCLDKTLSSSSSSLDENAEAEASHSVSNNSGYLGLEAVARHRRSLNRSSNRYIHLNESTASFDSHHLRADPLSASHRSGSFASNLSTSFPNNHNGSTHQTISSLNNFFSTAAAASASAQSQSSQGSGQPQVYYVSPHQQRTAEQMTEEEQIKLLKRMTLIQQLPTGTYDQNKKNKE
jgi:hypothetical protein